MPHGVTRLRNEVVEGLVGGTTMDEFMDMIRDLKIAQARRDEGQNFLGRRPNLACRCIWCDSLDHQRNFVDFKNALWRKIMYFSENQIH